MRFRMRLFAFLALLACCYVCYGFIVTSSTLITSMSAPSPTLDNLTTTDAKTVYQSMAVIGGSLTIAVFLCSGLPLALVFAALAWRNQIGLRRAVTRRDEANFDEDEKAADDWENLHTAAPE